MGISTYNPTSFEVTNQWFYNDFISVLPTLKGTSQQNSEFRITFKKDRKNDSMTFSSEHRADLLTEALQFQQLFADKTTGMLVSCIGCGTIATATYHEDCLYLFL
jgi:DnaJ family protein C protein 13